jgi:hypothetical protein
LEAQFAKCAHFKLPDTLAREAECIADLLQGQSSASSVPALEACCSASELTGSIDGSRAITARYAQNIGIIHDFFHHQ